MIKKVADFFERPEIKDQIKQLENNEKTIFDLAKETHEKITKADSKINAVINTYELEDELDDELTKKKISDYGDFDISGIPTLLKDNFNHTGHATTASSNILKDYISPYNATVTQRLLDNDAVILGKTNLDAFAHGSSTETSDFGVTKNPYDLSRVAGGSSGGAAAAVAAGYVSYTIGSETAGSVRGPASYCGAYGFAPSYGRISRYGVVAMGSSLDRPGVIANSVLDCAIVIDKISGNDPLDATSLPEKSTNYAKNLNNQSKKLVLGLPKQFMDDRIDKEIRQRTEEVVKDFEKLGYEIKEIDLLDPEYALAVYTIICRSEISSNLARIDGIRYGHNSEEKLGSIIDQIMINRGEGFGEEAVQRSFTGAYALSAGFYDAYYKKAQKVRRLIVEDFNKHFTEIDLMIGPTMPTVAPKIGETINDPLAGELADLLNESSALAGLPCISVPAGLNSKNLPIGIQLFGARNHEQMVLDTAAVYENNLADKYNQ